MYRAVTRCLFTAAGGGGGLGVIVTVFGVLLAETVSERRSS